MITNYRTVQIPGGDVTIFRSEDGAFVVDISGLDDGTYIRVWVNDHLAVDEAIA